MKYRLSVKQAAALMGVCEQFIRIGLQQGKFPWGYAVKMSTMWTYFISPQKFTEYTGINIKD
ncbi:MAG: hypothetical protein PHG19_07775 [Anaerotignum sp.]|nr:hypothetical protein [Anaerotignum sp.]